MDCVKVYQDSGFYAAHMYSSSVVTFVRDYQTNRVIIKDQSEQMILIYRQTARTFALAFQQCIWVVLWSKHVVVEKF